MATSRLPFCLALLLGAGLIAAAAAMSPQPISWSYRALRGLCDLDQAAALDGVRGAYPIGSRVDTKYGLWVCVEAIAQQSPPVSGGVWVRNSNI